MERNGMDRDGRERNTMNEMASKGMACMKTERLEKEHNGLERRTGIYTEKSCPNLESTVHMLKFVNF